MPECGEEATKQILQNKGSRMWGLRSGTQVSSGTSCSTFREHQQMLLDRIPLIPNVQSSWALLLHCAAAQANYFIRVVHPELSDEFATSMTMHCGCACQGCWTCALMHAPEARGTRPVCHCFWWHGTSKCCSNGGSSLLVQLGGRTEHDFTEQWRLSCTNYPATARRPISLQHGRQIKFRGLEGFEGPI